MHAARPATFACALCGSYGCADCRFGGEPPSRGPARHAVCRACAEGGLDEPVPWERRGELGIWRAFVDTTKLVTTEPTRFFRTPAIEKGVTGPVLYALGVYALGQLAGLVALGALCLLGAAVGGAVLGEPTAAGFFAMYGCVLIGIAPISVAQGAMQALVGMVIAAGAAHGTLHLMKATRGTFEATLRAVAYAYGPIVWMCVPGCGFVVAVVWSLAAELIGVRETHRTSTGAATLAVLGFRVLLALLFVGLYFAVGVAVWLLSSGSGHDAFGTSLLGLS